MNINLDENKSILYVKPTPPLKAEDFLELSSVADSYLKDHAMLKGLVIEVVKFPGWENIDAFMAHLKFIKNHQAKIKKIAVVTDSKFAVIGEKFIGSLVANKVKRFPFGEVALAQQWIEQ
jgi:hypothetical protein